MDFSRHQRARSSSCGGDTVVVVGNDSQPSPGATASWTPTTGTRVHTIDVSDPTRPTLTHTARYSSSLVAARQHGDVVRLVLSASLPDLPFTQPRWWRNDRRSLELNQEVVRHSTLDDWLPTVAFDGSAPTPAVDCSQVAIPRRRRTRHPHRRGLLRRPADRHQQHRRRDRLADRLSLHRPALPGRVSVDRVGAVHCRTAPCRPRRSRAEGVTRLYAFSLAGTQTTYVGSGESVATSPTAGRWTPSTAPCGWRWADQRDRQLQLRGDAGRARQRAGRGRPRRQARPGRADQVGALVRRPGPRGDVPGRPTRCTRSTSATPPGHACSARSRSRGSPSTSTRSATAASSASARTQTPPPASPAVRRWPCRRLDLGHPARLDAVRFARGTFAGRSGPLAVHLAPGPRDTALTVVTDGWDNRTGWVSVLRVGSTGLTQRLVEVECGADVARVRAGAAATPARSRWSPPTRYTTSI
ncbi:MAG: beta-propeller domain-containing protein [Nocardioides sp.]